MASVTRKVGAHGRTGMKKAQEDRNKKKGSPATVMKQKKGRKEGRYQGRGKKGREKEFWWNFVGMGKEDQQKDRKRSGSQNNLHQMKKSQFFQAKHQEQDGRTYQCLLGEEGKKEDEARQGPRQCTPTRRVGKGCRGQSR